jgi:hypothetical protein
MGGHRGGPCLRSWHAAAIEQSSHTWSSKFLSALLLLPTPDRMGEALRLTIGLDPGPMLDRPGGHLRVRSSPD